jgi:hypothetical protein
VTVIIGHSTVDFDAAVALMDDNIREELHAIASEDWTEQRYTDEYCRRHLAVHGEQFCAD